MLHFLLGILNLLRRRAGASGPEPAANGDEVRKPSRPSRRRYFDDEEGPLWAYGICP